MSENLSKTIELLSPAGNMECLHAAVAGGCDAVYLGISSFSARAFAGNFSHEEFEEAVRYCHTRGVKVYVTMNTLLFEGEIDQAMKEVDFLYEHDADALLVQDFGLFHRIRVEYPDFELHCSTQMHVHNAAGCLAMKEFGASRVVLARETPIEVIRACSKLGIETEVFVYGALCVSYSGQCLISESIKNRSGNRGVCAQMCRLRFYESNGMERCPSVDGEYALAMKDLNLLDHIKDLIEAGVSSLKIEGRMKRKEYVYLVTKTFREAIDAYYSGTTYILSKERKRQLELLFTRGFTAGHAFHDSLQQRMSAFRPNHRGVEIGRVVSFHNGKVTVDLSAPLYQHDGLRILNQPADTGLTAVRIEKHGKLVNSAGPGDRVILDCNSRPTPKKGQILLKTTDTRLLETLDQEIDSATRNIPVTITCKAVIGEPMELAMVDTEGHRAEVIGEHSLEAARNAPLTKERIEAILSKTADEPYLPSVVFTQLEDIFLPVSALNELRRRLYQCFSDCRAHVHTRAGKQPYQVILQPSSAVLPSVLIEDWRTPKDPEAINKLPVVSENECDKMKLVSTVISEPGQFWMERQDVIAGMSLNVTNSYAAAFLLSLDGMEGVILSSECNNDQIQRLKQRFIERYGFEPMLYQLVYGRRSLMVIKDYHPQGGYLEDLQKRLYPVVEEGNLTYILEPEPYVQANCGVKGSYLILTTEDRMDSEAIKEEAYEEISGRV
ncbi:MAG: U32 family peptidase [Solobacterium sp.]|nr:U32 family peptidase [Solobacterium sp.]